MSSTFYIQEICYVGLSGINECVIIDIWLFHISFTDLNKADFSSAVPYSSFFLIHSIFERLAMFARFKNCFKSKDKLISIDTALTCLR